MARRSHLSLLLASAFLASTTSLSSAITRHVRYSINPGCEPSLCNDSDVNHVYNLLHLRAVGPRDSVHAVWSTIGAPAALIATTGKDANLSVDWNELSHFNNDVDPPTPPPAPSHPVHFTSVPSVVFGFILRSLVEYDDVEGGANPDAYNWTDPDVAKKGRKDFPLDRRVWSPIQIVNNDTFVFQTSRFDPDFNESLRLQVRMSGTPARGNSLPRLQLTPNNTHVDLFLENKTSSFPHSRFFLVVDVVNLDYPLTLTSVRSIDDEYTPGVFTTFRLGAVDAQQPEKSRYAAWKPVAYTTRERSLEAQTLVRAMDAAEVDPEIDNVESVVGEYFGRIVQGDMSRQIKIGFGQQDDKFYRATNYSVWSVLIGVGAPPEDQISSLVIVVISVGLGVPAVFVVLGGIYAGIKDRMDRRTLAGGGREKRADLRAPLLEEEPETLTYGAIGT